MQLNIGKVTAPPAPDSLLKVYGYYRVILSSVLLMMYLIGVVI
jgi:hypothetical protein